MKLFLWIGVALVVLWAVLWLGFKIAVGAIHALLLIGLALVVWGFVAAKRAART